MTSWRSVSLGMERTPRNCRVSDVVVIGLLPNGFGFLVVVGGEQRVGLRDLGERLDEGVEVIGWDGHEHVLVGHAGVDPHAGAAERL